MQGYTKYRRMSKLIDAEREAQYLRRQGFFVRVARVKGYYGETEYQLWKKEKPSRTFRRVSKRNMRWIKKAQSQDKYNRV